MSDHENEPIAADGGSEVINEPTADPAPAAAAEQQQEMQPPGDPSAPRGDNQVFNGLLADGTWPEDSDEIRLMGDVAYATYGPDDKPPHDVTAKMQELEADGHTILHDNLNNYLPDAFAGESKKFRVWYKEGSVEQRKHASLFRATGAFKPKSLFLAIVFVNPFHAVRENSEQNEDGTYKELKGPHVGTMQGYPARGDNPETGMIDDDFLETPGLAFNDSVPNNFQKMIELFLRFKGRGLSVLPDDCLVEAAAPPAGQEWNWFRGHSLVEDKMFLSPDKDETYVQIHAQRKDLLGFAELQGLQMQTNPYSFAGGSGMIYNKQLDKELQKSVQDYMKHFKIPDEYDYCKGKLKDLDEDEEEELGPDGKPESSADGPDVPVYPNDVIVDGKRREWAAWGFTVEVPQKQRLLLRLIRAAYQFGGAGIQLDEIKRKAPDFIKNYFVLHNTKYQEAYELDRWAKFSNLVFNPCMWAEDWEVACVHYLGESTALYFSWMRRYVAHLSVAAIVGLACGIGQELTRYPAVIGGGYACFMVVWAILWIRSWQRYEQRFNVRWGQKIEAATELARDEFEPDFKRHINVERIYNLDFETPITMQRLPTGDLVELVYPVNKRLCVRYGVSYPLLTLLCGGMVAALFFTETYRADHRDDFTVSIGASIVSTMIIQICNKLSAILIDILNDAENCRTDGEYDDELILKSFAFTCVSNFFAVAWLTLGANMPNDVRMKQLKTQMVIQICVMPLVGNAVELLLPKVMTSLNKRVDMLGGYCTAICSYLCCCGCCESCNYKDKKRSPKNEREEAAIAIWKQSSLSPYTTSAGDYLEVVLSFGWVMLFATIFPWGGLSCFILSIMEIRVDATKLITEHQRPVARVAQSIGAFTMIMFIFTGVAVALNSYVVTIVANGPAEAGMATDDKSLFEAHIKLQYFLLLAVLVLGVIRTTVSPSVHKAELKLGMLGDRAIQDYVRKMLKLSPKALQETLKAAEEEIAATNKDQGCC